MKLTGKRFDRIYSTVPRVVVELLIQNKKGILLTRRSINPFKYKWHIPGGTVEIGQEIKDVLQSVAKRELGDQIVRSSFYKIHQYDKPFPHISLVYKVKIKGEIILNDQASEYGYYKKKPNNLISAHRVFFPL